MHEPSPADRELWPIGTVAAFLGYTGPSANGSARKALSREGVEAVSYERGANGRAEARYDAAQARDAFADRPGAGTRTDLLEHPVSIKLPPELLDRALVAEADEMPGLPDEERVALRFLLSTIVFDAAWAEQPGELLAGEAEDAAGEDLPEETARVLAAAARSWTRFQTLAVIHAASRNTQEAPA